MTQCRQLLAAAAIALAVASCSGDELGISGDPANEVTVGASTTLSLPVAYDTDCDDVPDYADAKPYEPNDIEDFLWEPVENGPLPPGDLDRCDLDGNGIIDIYDPDPEAIEAAARRAAVDARAANELAQARAAAEEARQEQERKDERAERDRVEAIDRQRCLDSVAALNAEIDSAAAEAEEAGWTDAAHETYDRRLDAAMQAHGELMSELSTGC